MRTIHFMAAALAIVGLAAQAQTPKGITRSDVVKHDISVPGREAVQVRVDFEPGAAFPRHTHPGEEIAFVIEGEVQYQFDGQAPVTLKAGQALFIPAGTVHLARNVGTVKASELATYIVAKDKPAVEVAK